MPLVRDDSLVSRLYAVELPCTLHTVSHALFDAHEADVGIHVIRILLFHRRLIVLTLIFIGVLSVLAVQAVTLTLVEGTERLKKAEGRLYITQYLPTWRGRILDRHGRVLAQDEASFDIAVPWDLITGDRAKGNAGKNARNSVSTEVWKSMTDESKEELIGTYLPQQEAELAVFWDLIARRGDVTPEMLKLRMQIIRDKVNRTAEVVWQRQEEVYLRQFGDIETFTKRKERPIAEHRTAHVVLSRVDDETAMKFTQLSEELEDAIEVQHSRYREYPAMSQTILLDRSTLPRQIREMKVDEITLSGVGDLLLGDIRNEVWAEDMDRRPFGQDLGGYRVGDEVGHRGLEFTLEEELRGKRGFIKRNRLGEELERKPPVGGRDVQLTLDIALQARIEAILSPQTGLMHVQPWHRNAGLKVGTALRGAVVVLDAKSGVLAMASTPAIRDESSNDGYPWLNRASDGLYPAGSIIKPLVLAAATTEGLYDVGEEIQCKGHFYEHVTNSARCWIYRKRNQYRTHGKLKAVEALARSCNIFYYELGSRLGFHRLLDWYERFGLSQPLSARLVNAAATGRQGHVPSAEDITYWARRGELAFETISMSIGQGPITWSPLHAAAAYATLARGGLWRSPSLILGATQQESDLHLDPTAVQYVIDGLHDSLNKEYGTGSLIRYGVGDSESIFNVQEVKLWGKTGTAEAPPYRASPDSKVIRGLDHAWFLVMAGQADESTPSVIVAVLIEHGGSGGRVAGPIANQVVHALRLEGYLGGRK